MRLITIEIEDEYMVVGEGETKGARPLFIAPGLTVRVVGELSGSRYEQATALALAVCHEMHIPAISLRRDVKPIAKRSFDTDTKRMF